MATDDSQAAESNQKPFLQDDKKIKPGDRVRITNKRIVSGAKKGQTELQDDYLMSKKELIGLIGIVSEKGPTGQDAKEGFHWVELEDLSREEVHGDDLDKITVLEKNKLVAEFLGSFLFVFALGANLATGLHDGTSDVFGPTAIGCCLMVLVYSLSPISGGHVNPAVTVAVWLLKGGKEFKAELAMKYMLVQAIGGGLAGLAVGFLSGFETSSLAAEHAQIQGFAYAIGAPLAEFFYTFLLCFVFLNTCNGLIPNKEHNRYFGVAVGFVYIAAHGCSQVSGAALNPAVSFGVNFMGPSWKSLDAPISIAAQLFGAGCAYVAVRIVRPSVGQIGEADKDNQVQQKFDLVNNFLDKKLQENKYFDKDDSAEFLGTFFVCLTISLNAMIPPDKNVTQLWSVAASYMVMIWTLGDVSGGVFNPALTLAYAIRWYKTGQGFGVAPGIQLPSEIEGGAEGEVDYKLGDPVLPAGKKEFLKYCALQLIGGACGTGATTLIYMASGEWPAPHVGPLMHKNSTSCPPGEDQSRCEVAYTDGQAFFAEFCGTFLLAFVVLAVQNHALIKDYAALAIGGAVIAAGYSFGPISGGFFNPSSTLACSIGRELAVLTSVAPLMYLTAQLTGASAAAVAFRYATHDHEFSHVQ